MKKVVIKFLLFFGLLLGQHGIQVLNGMERPEEIICTLGKIVDGAKTNPFDFKKDDKVVICNALDPRLIRSTGTIVEQGWCVFYKVDYNKQHKKLFIYEKTWSVSKKENKWGNVVNEFELKNKGKLYNIVIPSISDKPVEGWINLTNGLLMGKPQDMNFSLKDKSQSKSVKYESILNKINRATLCPGSLVKVDGFKENKILNTCWLYKIESSGVWSKRFIGKILPLEYQDEIICEDLYHGIGYEEGELVGVVGENGEVTVGRVLTQGWWGEFSVSKFVGGETNRYLTEQKDKTLFFSKAKNKKKYDIYIPFVSESMLKGKVNFCQKQEGEEQEITFELDKKQLLESEDELSKQFLQNTLYGKILFPGYLVQTSNSGEQKCCFPGDLRKIESLGNLFDCFR